MIASLLLSFATMQTPVIGGREPTPAETWRQSVSFQCGRDLLEISGYGPARPPGHPVRIRLNGRTPVGERLGDLVLDLGRTRAVYRITALCDGQGRPGISVILYRGENVGDGVVEYRSAGAYFRGGHLTSYTGLQNTDATGFWFR